MHEAAWRGYSRCVKLLCTLPQKSRLTNKKLGRKAKDVKHVEDEWRNEIYLNTPNAGGFSPLHLAAQNGHNQSCREILLAGANPDVKNNVSAIDHFSNSWRRCTISFSYFFSKIFFSMVILHYIHRVVTDMRVLLEF